jgi:carboxymethylenebutenolidase
MMMHPELATLVPEENPDSRRQFLMKKLAVGFALAVSPVGAQTITTDTNGLEAGEVKISVKDGVIPAYRAMPAAKGKKMPVVLVVQEIFGVHEHIKDICRRFAKLGYFAIAPELYARQGDVSKLEMGKIISEVVSKVPDAQVMSDLDAAVAYAASTKRVDIKKLGVTGFCWGGRIVWLYSAHNPGLKAGAAWYGRLAGGQPNDLQPKMPVDVAGNLHGAILGLYGEKDTGIPLESVEKMKAAAKAANKNVNIIVYKDAPHGFHADYRPSYRKADAEAAWKELLAWFKKNGVA